MRPEVIVVAHKLVDEATVAKRLVVVAEVPVAKEKPSLWSVVELTTVSVPVKLAAEVMF